MSRIITRTIVLGVAVAVGSLSATHVASQATKPPAKTVTPYSPPRLPGGHPDLQGMWNTATITPLERPAQHSGKESLSEEEAARLEKQERARSSFLDRPSRPDRTAPPVGGDGSTGPAGNVGGYNYFWIDRGTEVISVNGERRSSLIIDPPDGRVPPQTPEARRRNAARLGITVAPTSDAPETVGAGEGPGAYDDPERRPLGERCIMGFGSTAGPPALPVLYNNFKQIVQTRDFVMILNEMNHDARIVPLNRPHAPPSIRRWMGDSVAHWEGDTLVIDTTNFTDKTRFRGSTTNLHVVERFTRVAGNAILYKFTVEDPATWTRAWSGEYPWIATDDLLYEYACHEANYALGDILRGERLLEKERQK